MFVGLQVLNPIVGINPIVACKVHFT